MYVSQLDENSRKKIKNEVQKALVNIGLHEELVNEGVELAMDSKLIDLQDMIDLNYSTSKCRDSCEHQRNRQLS